MLPEWYILSTSLALRDRQKNENDLDLSIQCLSSGIFDTVLLRHRRFGVWNTGSSLGLNCEIVSRRTCRR